MLIKEKKPFNSQNHNILQELIKESLTKISSEDMKEEREQITSSFFRNPLFTPINNELEYQKRFICYPQEITQYFMSGAPDIVRYVTQKYIKEMVFFNLMNEGVLMPVAMRQNRKVEINIEHAHGNCLWDIYFDLMPYESFVLVKKCDEIK